MPSKRETSTPAERLLDTAATLFGRHGIRAVGIDRLLKEAKVARASMYESFGSKDALVVAYLKRQDATDRAALLREIERRNTPVERVLAAFDLAEANARRRRYRGCLYLNAATEFPDHGNPVMDAVLDHRQWLHQQWLTCLCQAGVADPAVVVRRLHLLYDGALAGSKADRSCEPIRLARQMAEDTIEEAISGPRSWADADAVEIN